MLPVQRDVLTRNEGLARAFASESIRLLLVARYISQASYICDVVLAMKEGCGLLADG